MISGIPLPKAPPGSFQEGFSSANELSKGLIENRIKAIEAQYAPLKTFAQASSQLAYANLMSPQFLAKLAGNEDVMASLDKTQRQQLLDTVYRAGAGQNVANNILANPSVFPGIAPIQNPLFQLIGAIASGARNIFTNGSQNAPQNTLQNAPQTAIPASSRTPSINQSVQSPVTEGSNQSANQSVTPSVSPSVSGDYFETAGTEIGKKEQGREAGKLRARAIDEMSNEYATSQKLNDSYMEMNGLINNDAFRKMRTDLPFFQNTQMHVMSKIGTPEQQELIGQFKSAAQKILANAVNSFEGRKFLGEFKTTSDMKINENDTFNTIIGKMQAGMLLNDYGRKRIEIASGLMKYKHMDKQEALQISDRQLDRKTIEDQIKNLVRVTIRNKKTGEEKTIPVHEARRMGVKNV